MARTPRMMSKNKTKYVQYKVNPKQQRKAVEASLDTLGLLSQDVKDFTQACLFDFISEFANATKSLERPSSIVEFEDACKKRFLTLQELVNSSKSAIAEGINISVQRRLLDGTIRTFKGKYENRLVIVDYDDPDHNIHVNNINPRCYTPLFKGVYTILYALSMAEEGDMDVNDLHLCLLLLLSWGKLYENLRGNLDFKLMKEQEALERMKTEINDDPWKHNSITDVIDEIRHYVDFGGRAPLYIRDIVDAISKLDYSPYSEDDYSYSFRSTGTKDKQKRTVPGLYASLVEPGDQDEPSIGFVSPYSSEISEGYTNRGNHIIAIEQSKLAPRIIQITTNRNQDVGNYFHRRLESITRTMSSDCTFNQDKGVFFIQRVTSPMWRQRNRNNVYCTDISDATGTVNQRYQHEILNLIFGEERANVYMDLIFQDRTMMFSDGTSETFTQTMGQPQGYKGSFPLFALGHHIVVRAAMHELGYRDVNPRDLYVILGDDIAISVPDPNREFLNLYIELCKSINWTVHPSKGYRYFYDDPVSQPIAEFAKVTVLNGQVFSPIPINLLLNSPRGYEEKIQLMSWISKMVRPISVDTITYYLNSDNIDVNATFQWYLNAVRSLKISGVLEDFTEVPVEISEEDKVYILYSFLRKELNTMLLEQFLPDHLRYENATKTPEYIGSQFDSYHNLICESITNFHGKYHIAIERNNELIEAIQTVIEKPEEYFLADSVITMDLNPDEVQALLQITEILSVSPDTWFGQSGIIQDHILMVQKFANRLSLRSLVKRRKKDSILLIESYHGFLETKSSNNSNIVLNITE